MRLLVCLFASIASVSLASETAPLAKPELLAEVESLRNHLGGTPQFGDRPVTLLDVRAQELHLDGRIPGARHVDAAEWKAAFGEGSDKSGWSERIGKVLGSREATVIVYDDVVSSDAARIWWILKYWGVEDARLLNGGYKTWRAEGGDTEEGDPAAAPDAIAFEAQPNPSRLATYADVLAIAADGEGTCLLDARTVDENTAGQIPSARHLDWQTFVDTSTGKLRSPDELRAVLGRVQFDPATPAVTYCQSGGRASVTAFVVELVSGEPAANYYGSWGEWSKRGGPVDQLDDQRSRSIIGQ